MELYQRIKQICKEKGITVQALERLSGVSNGSISKWDRSSPQINSLVDIADALNISMDYLLGFSDSQDRQSQPDLANTSDYTDKQKQELISIYERLKKSGKQKMLIYSKGLLDGESEDL